MLWGDEMPQHMIVNRNYKIRPNFDTKYLAYLELWGLFKNAHDRYQISPWLFRFWKRKDVGSHVEEPYVTDPICYIKKKGP